MSFHKNKYHFFITVFCLCLFVSLFAGAVGGILVNRYFDSSQNFPVVSMQKDLQVVDVVQKVNPAVVSVVISKDVSKLQTAPPGFFSFDDFYQFGVPFREETENVSSTDEVKPKIERIGGGSGFIIRADGLIVTNKHVVEDEEAIYTVVLATGEEKEAAVVARDTLYDLALLKIEGKDLPTLPLGDSDTIRIGQSVIAIGYTLAEFGNTVTVGVVSGIGRRVEAGSQFGDSEILEEAIQTDAAINPGNSGGPLLNLRGEVIGINTAVSREGQSVGFAIPVNSVKKNVESFVQNGRIIRPWLGVRFVPVTPRFAEANKLPVNYGALVIHGDTLDELAVIPGSPADKAGIMENDIILEINGTRLEDKDSLVKLVSKMSVHDEVVFKLFHKGEEKEVTVRLEEYPTK